MADIVWLSFGNESNCIIRPIALKDVMNSFIDWNEKEITLYNEINKNGSVNYKWFSKLLSYYGQGRLFPLKYRNNNKSQDEISQILNDILKNHKQYNIDILYDLVTKLQPFSIYKNTNDHNLITVCSQILWFFYRDNVIIINSEYEKSIFMLIQEFQSQVGLEEFILEDEEYEDEMIFDLELDIDSSILADNYISYSDDWLDCYLQEADEIKELCDALYDLFQQEGFVGNFDYDCLKSEWFLRKCFNSWLYNLYQESNKA